MAFGGFLKHLFKENENQRRESLIFYIKQMNETFFWEYFENWNLEWCHKYAKFRIEVDLWKFIEYNWESANLE